MAKIFITTNNTDHDHTCRDMKHLASIDSKGEHTLVSNPEEADLILFAATAAYDPFFSQLKNNQLLRQYPQRCRVFCESDYAIPFVSGVYASIEKGWFTASRHRTGPYISMYQNDAVTYQPSTGDEPYLYSFTGDSQTHRSREHILSLRDDRALLRDTHAIGQQVRKIEDPDKLLEFKVRYATTLRDSKFVVCPRGFSVSSVRLYDTLKTGRVPVVISNAWVPPTGPDWNQCCLFVKENRVSDIPRILRDAEADYPRMADAAYQTYKSWFAQDVLFHRIVEWCLALQPAGLWYNSSSVRAILSKKHFKRYSKMLVKKYVLPGSR